MKDKLKGFWSWLASEPISGASVYSWRRQPVYHRIISRFLSETGETVNAVICHRCTLPHRVVLGSSEETIAVSEDDGCDDFKVEATELYVCRVDYIAFLKSAANCLPIQIRPEQIDDSAAWLIGIGVRRTDGIEVPLVMCLSTKEMVVRHAMRSVQRRKLRGCILAMATDNLSEVEDQMGEGTRAFRIEDLLEVSRTGFAPGLIARQVLAGWPDDAPNASVYRNRERAFERCGFRASKVGNKPFRLPIWRCHFEGRTFDLPPVLGSHLLVKVMAADGEPVYADSLLRSAESSGAGLSTLVERPKGEEVDNFELGGTVRRQVDSREQILDAIAIKRVQEALRIKKVEIVECGDDPALASEKERLQVELEAETDYLLRSTRPGPGGTRLPKAFNDSFSKAGNLVGKHFRNVLKQLQTIDRSLWEHLTRSEVLRFGNVCQYVRQGGKGWRVTGLSD